MGKPGSSDTVHPLLGVVFYLLSNSDRQMNSFTDLSFAVDFLKLLLQ